MPRRDAPPSEGRAGPSGAWNVPHLRNLHFTGREELLNRLDQQLSPAAPDDPTTTRRAALTQPQAIKGLGGIGKTQIAIEYAYRSHEQERYTHTLWVNAASEETLITSFAALAELLPSFSAKNEIDQRKLVVAIKRWLEQCKQRWLLVFDNADDISLVQEYLPQRGNGSILLTTRADAVGSLATSLEVETMGLVEGTEFLLHRAQRLPASDGERNEATNVVVALDCFPLALDQAGAYIEETKCCLVDYLKIYQDHRKELLAKRGKLATNYPDSVATTWLLSFQKVEQANQAAAELLRLCAFLAPDRIPEELIRESAVHWGPLLQRAAADLFAFNQMIEELLKFSLVKRLVETHMLSIHRLVQTVQMGMIEPDEQHRWAERVVRGVESVFPQVDVTTWPQCGRYLSQAQACVELIEKHELTFSEAPHLLTRTAHYLQARALYPIAESLFRRALEIREHAQGTEHPDTADSLINLAKLYHIQSDHGQAEPLYQRALKIQEHVQGADHPETVVSVTSLAMLYHIQGKYELAESLYQHALEVMERVQGADHLYTAISLTSLATLYSDLDKYELAEPLYRHALEIRERVQGTDHPDTADSLISLATLYRDQGNYEQAEPLYQRALEIRERIQGANHPDVADNCTNLATLYYDQGNYEQAEPLYQRALEIRERVQGADHPDVADCIADLAMLYYEWDDDEQAERLYWRALKIRERVQSTDDPITANWINNLATLYCDRGDYEKAEQLYRRALEIRERVLSANHPDTATSLTHLALLYHHQGQYEQAEPLYRRALEIREQILGADHLDTAKSRNNLAALYRDQAENASTDESSQ